MQITRIHVGTRELGQQVPHPLPGSHVTVGKNTIMQVLTQLLLLALSIGSGILFISVKEHFHFSYEMIKTA